MTRSAQAPLLRQGGAVQLPPERRPTGASRRSLVAVLGFLVAAGLALVGQRWLSEGTYRADGVALLVAGGVLLLILLSWSGPLAASLLTPDDNRQDDSLFKPDAAAERWSAGPGLRRLLLGVTTVSAVVAFEQAGGGLFRLLGVVAWVLAIGSFGLAFGEFRRFDLRGLRSRLRAVRDARCLAIRSPHPALLGAGRVLGDLAARLLPALLPATRSAGGDD